MLRCESFVNIDFLNFIIKTKNKVFFYRTTSKTLSLKLLFNVNYHLQGNINSTGFFDHFQSGLALTSSTNNPCLERIKSTPATSSPKHFVAFKASTFSCSVN